MAAWGNFGFDRAIAIMAVVVSVGVASAAWGQAKPIGPPEPDLGGGSSGGSEGLDPAVLRVAYDTARRAGDLVEVERTLTAMWQVDAEQGRKLTLLLIKGGKPAERPIAASLLGDRLAPREIGEVIRGLRSTSYPEERRWLTRALGKKGGEALPVLKVLLEDRDPYIRAAAVRSIGQLGDASAVPLFIRDLTPFPEFDQRVRASGHRFAMMMATNGAAYALTKIHPGDQKKLADWVKRQQRESRRPTKPTDESEPTDRDKEAAKARAEGKRISTQHFDIYFEFNRSGDIRETLEKGGVKDLQQFGRDLEQACEPTRKASTKVFGGLLMPPAVLIFSDQANFSRHGGPSHGAYGYAAGHRIVQRFTEWGTIRDVLPHEYVHVIQGAHFPNQPRWLMEGVAESLSRSPSFSTMGQTRAKQLGVDQLVARGGLTALLRWNAGVSTNLQKERPLYALGHFVIDYLRFGGHSAADARLAFLMGRINRGDRPATAIAETYGMSVREMDKALLKWLQARPAVPTPPKEAGPQRPDSPVVPRDKPPVPPGGVDF